MTIKRYFLSLILLLTVAVSAAGKGMGTWKSYLSYSNIQWIEQGGNKLYVLASSSLYSYNKNDKSIQTYDKTSGLSDMDIRLQHRPAGRQGQCDECPRLLPEDADGRQDRQRH